MTQQELIDDWRFKARMVELYMPIFGVVNEKTIAVVLRTCAEELEEVIGVKHDDCRPVVG